METYSRIGLLRSYGNLQSYWTTTKLWKLAVVLDYCNAIGMGVIVMFGAILYMTGKAAKTDNNFSEGNNFSIFSPRFECNFPSSPLVSSVISHLLHSFRVYLFRRYSFVFTRARYPRGRALYLWICFFTFSLLLDI